jgi:hypothetical protein
LVATLDRVFHEEWGRVLAALIGFLGDFDLAEESAQEAFGIAADRWLQVHVVKARDACPDPDPLGRLLVLLQQLREGHVRLDVGERAGK